MHEGQEKFLAFFLSNTQPEKQPEAKALLIKSFAEQQTRALTLVDFETLQAQLLPLIQPEKLVEVKQAMAHFSQNLQ